jgi:hypothetical protein
MAYNALNELFRINKEMLGVDSDGIPELEEEFLKDDKDILKRSACEFIRKCEDLNFDLSSDEFEKYREILREFREGKEYDISGLTGRSIRDHQIPKNVEKDIDRLTFENAILHFCDSGSAEDAFDVYFCYLSIFFGDYRNTRDIIEMLCEFENNAGALLMKHRDHYVHSVYVFLLGLTIYENMCIYRRKYKEYYEKKFRDENRIDTEQFNDTNARNHFLKFWGLTSLFHDIGYPFELPFEEIKGYFANSVYKRTAKNIKDKFIPTMPYVSYQNMYDFLSNLNINSDCISQKELNEKIDQWTGNERVCDLSDIFSLHLSKAFTRDYKYYDAKPFVDYCESKGIKLPGNPGEAFKTHYRQIYRRYLQDVLTRKPSHPESFDGYMDHAYFSAILMLHRLNEMKDLKINTDYTDALSAILIHNSIFKRSIVTKGNIKHAFTIDESPLAYLLMLCDELQCWDRASYGLNNRNAIYAMDCRLEYNDRDDSIIVRYIYDSYFLKNKRIDFCEWIKDQARLEGKSIKDFYKRFRNCDEKMYSEKYKDIYEKFKTVVDNPKADLPEKMNDYLSMSTISEQEDSKFFSDIKEIVSVDGESGIHLEIPSVNEEFTESPRKNRKAFLSRSSYMHLYDFAVALNHQYNCRNEKKEFIGASQKEMENSFTELSLEYQISNINQAKAFAQYLDSIGCFFTDRPVEFTPLREFKENELAIIGEKEHSRWWQEKIAMGWTPDEWIETSNDAYGELTRKFDFKNNKWLRECLRIHCDMRLFDKLSEEDINKDTDPMNDMVKLLEEYDGLRIYRK